MNGPQYYFALAQTRRIRSKRQVSETLRKPEKVEEGFRRRKVAQRKISAGQVLRVVYEEKQNEIIVVTFYPGRRSRYESSL